MMTAQIKKAATFLRGRKLTDQERNSVIPGYVWEGIRNQTTQQKNLRTYMKKEEFYNPYEQKSVMAISMQPEMKRAESDFSVQEVLPAMTISRRIQSMSQLAKTAGIIHDTQIAGHQEAKKSSIEDIIGMAAANIARDIQANCIVSLEKSSKDTDDLSLLAVKVAIFKQLQDRKDYKKYEYQTTLSKQANGSIIPIKDLLMESVNKQYIEKNDRVVCVADGSLGTGYNGLMFIFDVDKIFFNISTHHLTENVKTDVLEATINIALELGTEGREGRKVGTAFIVGKKENILKHTRQLVINPFAGTDEKERNITDPRLKETVKGFSQLDGAFIVNDDGCIVTAGTHLNLDLSEIELPSLAGFGTRHRYAAAITKVTDAIAVVVSETGGIVRIFKNGKIVLRLP
ncbi:diadenylate cyclase [Candidatus Woesearchaeota archaeon]|nr:diadenylate cyclase [Candidatus Woesearchaeota archaeon]